MGGHPLSGKMFGGARRLWGGLILLVLAADGAAIAQEKKPFEAYLPATTIAAFTFHNPSQTAAYKESAVYKMSQTAEMQAFCQHVKGEIKRLLALYGAALPINLNAVLELFQGEVSLAFTGLGMGEQGPEPGIIFSVVSPQGPDRAETLMLTLVANALRRPSVTVQPGFQHDGQDIKAIALPKGKLYFTRVDDRRLLITYGKTSMMQALTFAKTQKGALDQWPAFKACAEQTRWSRSMVRLYVNTTALFTQLGAVIPPPAADWWQAQGLGCVQAAAFASRFENGGMYDAIYLYCPGQRQGVIPPAGQPVDLKLLRLVPKNCGLMQLQRVNFARTYDHIMSWLESNDARAFKQAQDALRSAEAKLGFSIRDDLIASFAGQALLSLAPYQSILALELTEPAQFENCMQRLPSLAPGKIAWRQLKYRERTIHYLDIMGAPVPVCPSYVIYDRFAVIGLFPQSLEAFLVQAEGRRGSILDNADFQRVCGKYLKGCDAVSYLDVKSGLKGFYNLLVIASYALHGVKQVQLRAELAPRPDLIEPYLFGAGTGEINTQDGLLTETFSPIGATGALLGFLGSMFDMSKGPSVQATIIPISAAMIMPALARARAQARGAVCKSNLKQIGLAIAMYSVDFNEQYPKSLDELFDQYITIKKIFVCPSDSHPFTIGKGLKCSYVYVGRLPTPTDPGVAICWDKRGNHRGGRNVLFYDGHVQWMREGAFRRELRRSLQTLQRAPTWQKLPPARRAQISALYTNPK